MMAAVQVLNPEWPLRGIITVAATGLILWMGTSQRWLYSQYCASEFDTGLHTVCTGRRSIVSCVLCTGRQSVVSRVLCTGRQSMVSCTLCMR